MASIEPRIPISLLAARYRRVEASQAASAPAVPAVPEPAPAPRPSAPSRMTAEQERTTPSPSESSSDDELDDPDAWCDALDVGQPARHFERMLEEIGNGSDDEVGNLDITVMAQPDLTSSNPAGPSALQAIHGREGDNGSGDGDDSGSDTTDNGDGSDDGASSEEDESDGNGDSGTLAARTVSTAVREDSEVGSGDSSEEEEE